MTEVSDVIAGTLPYDEIPLLIDQRRVEKEACENLDVPDEIIGEPPPLEELRRTIQGGTHFEGIGCSPGIVTGKARVIKDIHQACDIEKGEILVIPVTDPGWSPLFVAASGIIVELGGTLSHGVIIAREYGVPTIVGIKNATDIFHTGQLITIDGGKGLVSVEDEFHD
jgi:pyruvate,water dikinase